MSGDVSRFYTYKYVVPREKDSSKSNNEIDVRGGKAHIEEIGR